MLALPPVAPVTGWRSALRLPRDHYVRVDSNDYSVHPGSVGRRVEVVTDLDRVQAFSEDRLVADHPRSWMRHQTFTDPGHADAARTLRRQHRALASMSAGQRAGAGQDDQVEVEQRRLADYDERFGLVEPASPPLRPAAITAAVTEDGTEGGVA